MHLVDIAIRRTVHTTSKINVGKKKERKTVIKKTFLAARLVKKLLSNNSKHEVFHVIELLHTRTAIKRGDDVMAELTACAFNSQKRMEGKRRKEQRQSNGGKEKESKNILFTFKQ